MSRLRRRGFSLLELMLVIAVAGVLTTLAVMTLRDIVNSRREISAARGIGQLLKRARLTALDTHSRVQVSADTATSVVKLTACKAAYGTDACAGALSFTDVPQGELVLNAGDLQGVKLSAAPGSPLIFNASGFPETPGTYTYTVDQPERPGTLSLVVNTAGEIRVQ